MKRQAKRIEIVSWERITAELIKILETAKPSQGLTLLQYTGLMKYIFPEVDNMYGLEQAKELHHKDIFYHTMQVVDNAAVLSKKMEVRFAALVHDIAKPRTRSIDSKKGYTFHGHDSIGTRMLDKIAKRMKLSNELRDYLKNLTLLHLRPIALAKEGITDSAVRRVMVSAGENIDDLLILCRADITSKNPKLVKKYLGNFERVEKLMLDVKERDNFKEFQSPVRGKEIMKECGLSEGRLIGQIKQAIEEAILEGEIENNYEAAYDYLVQIRDQYTS
jgi:putative nucleotidyltransferase with HDIG domain